MYPLQDAYAWTLSSAYIDLAGSRFLGVQKITWSEVMEGRENVPGAAYHYVARTAGIYKASVEIEILTSEFMALTQKLGRGFMMTRFNAAAQLVDPAGVLPLFSMVFPALTIDDNGGSLEQKASTTVLKTTVGPMRAIEYNGITAVSAGYLGSSVGNSFGGSASVVAQVGATVGFSL